MYMDRILLHTEEGCTWCQIPAKVISLYILGVSFCLFHEHVKVLFFIFTFLCIFETLPDRKILYTHLNSAQNVLLSSPVEVRGTKKQVKFCCPV
jgi:hypothetical protein